MNLFAPLPSETRRLLNEIDSLIDKVFPLPGRFRSALPHDVAELSRLLTSGRGERGLSYLGRPALLSAYLRFFLPWNLYRLCRLLPGLDIPLAANDRITDIGCGPLTLTAALWVSRPDLRSLPLEFHCIDRSGPALDAGKKFFAALAGENSPWKIHTIRGDLGETAAAKIKPAALVCAINVFNEMYGDISRSGAEDLHRSAEKSARLLGGLVSKTGHILVVEPGFPRCGEFISLLRGVLLERGRKPLSPCTHEAACPLDRCPLGKCPLGKKRWCHFAFETGDAPAALHRLSSAARLPKERAVLSFLFAGPVTAETAIATTPAPELRVISDAFSLPQNRWGRYACSAQGLVLLTSFSCGFSRTVKSNMKRSFMLTGEKTAIEKIPSGALVNAIVKKERDSKSGALLGELLV